MHRASTSPCSRCAAPPRLGPLGPPSIARARARSRVLSDVSSTSVRALLPGCRIRPSPPLRRPLRRHLLRRRRHLMPACQLPAYQLPSCQLTSCQLPAQLLSCQLKSCQLPVYQLPSCQLTSSQLPAQLLSCQPSSRQPRQCKRHRCRRHAAVAGWVGECFVKTSVLRMDAAPQVTMTPSEKLSLLTSMASEHVRSVPQ